MKHLKIFLLLLATFGSSPLFGQLEGQAFTDSLLRELPKQKEDTNKANLLLTICTQFRDNNPDETIKYATEALHLSQKVKWPVAVIGAYALIGGAYGNKGENAKALENYTKALAIAREINDTGAISGMYMNIGMVYEMQKNGPRALEYYYKALKGFEEVGNKKKMVGITNNIGNVHFDQKNYAKALEYYSKALAINQQIGNRRWEAFNLANVAIVYNELGAYEQALDYNQKALKINEELGDTAGMCTNLLNIGYGYQLQKKYSMALAWYARALAAAERTGNKQLQGNAFGNIGETYLGIVTDTSVSGDKPDSVVRMGNKRILERAAQHLKSGIALSAETGDLAALREFTGKLSDVYYELGDRTEALKWYKQSVAFKDSIFNADNSTRITNLETQREIDLKDKQIQIDELAVAKKRNERGFFIAGIAAMLVIIIITFKSYETQKKGNKLLSIEKQKSEDLLLNILPAEVAEELKAKGSAEATLIDEVTVLFTDFKGFTQLSEKLSPKELVGEINTCFSAFDNIMQKHGVEKIKTIGDAYMAAGGLPTPNKTHATDVVKAAMEIQDFMRRHKEEREAAGKLFFEIRIGVHTGPVVAGIVGIKKFAYDIWGDTVNTASRMESSGSVGKVNISDTTYELVKDKFPCEYRGEVEAKGKGVMRMYFVQ